MLENDFRGIFYEAYENYLNSLSKARILILGSTGAGKSTLCNLVFKKEMARVGSGRPVTQNIDEYENDFVVLYDSAGYETGEQNQRRFNKLIFSFAAPADMKERAVDIAWYCVNAPAARFTELDADLIKKLQQAVIPTAVVLTKIDLATEAQCAALANVIRGDLPNIPVFESSTDETIAVANGLDELFAWSLDNVDSARRKAFIAASNRDLGIKEKACSAIIKGAAAAAVAAAAVPLPGADAPVLVSIQLGMLSKIFATWDIASIEQTAKSLVVEIISVNAGRLLSGNLLKLVPGAGQLIAAGINASVASAITYAVGTSFNKMCRYVTEQHLAGKEVLFEEMFGSQLMDEILGSLGRKFKK
jgi:uncharacterized protein (DUF697 family)/GTP-binding protein EngB required for normal cell division